MTQKSVADVHCKLCFLPEGDSVLVRVGKRKVRHADCSKAWSAEDLAKGREHCFMKQIERVEEAMMALPVEPNKCQSGACDCGCAKQAELALALPEMPSPDLSLLETITHDVPMPILEP